MVIYFNQPVNVATNSLCKTGGTYTTSISKEAQMTLDEIRATKKPFLTPEDVAEAMGIASQSLRDQVTRDASKVGFPVVRVGTRTKIPREAFLKFIAGESK